VSLRRAFDDSPTAVDRFFELIETAWAQGYSAARVHGRTVEQKYQGRASWPILADIKRRYPDRTILGSGDVFTAEDAVRMLRETGVDIVWIARGAIGNPWIFQHVAALLAQEQLPKSRQTEPSGSADGLAPPGIHEQREALAEHFAIAMQIHGESLAGRRMRKMGIKYSRFHPDAAHVKRGFIEVHSLRDWTAVLDRWYTHDGSGVWPAATAANEVNADEQSCEPAAF
jgi:tRNA-dihydrouridine synthase